MFKIFLKLLGVARTRIRILGSGSVKKFIKNRKMQMIPDPDVVRIRKSYQTKGECLGIRILESGFRTFLCGPQIRIGSVPYGTDPLLRFQLGPSHVFVRVTGI